MLIAIALFGVLVVLIGLTLFVKPAFLKRILAFYDRGSWLYGALVFRLLLGLLLIAAAEQCRFPGVIRVIGFISLAAAVTGFAIGLDRIRRFAAWWGGQGPIVVRLWSLLAVAFGVFLVYAAM